MIDTAAHPAPDTGTVDAENPWPGLAAFREADQQFFQGRDAVIDELTRMVLRARLTALYGVSGLGKTSVLRAGLFPRLRGDHVLPVYVRLSHAEENPPPAEQVREAIADAAAAASVEPPASVPGETLWEYFHRKGAHFWDGRNRVVTPLLVFDQFEELFTLGRTTAERRGRGDAFVNELADLVEGRPSADVRARLEAEPEEALRFSMSDLPCKVLLSLREDFLPHLAALRDRMPTITDTMYRILPMTPKEAMRVVEVGGGRLVDRGVAEQIVTFVASAKSESPDDEAAAVEPALLSVFCRELNHKRRLQNGEKITADLLEGSRTAIIADFYERTISAGGLSPDVREFVEERLLTESGFRDSVAEEQALNTPGITPADIETLIGRRLLRREDAGSKGRSRLELTHDVLAQAVRASRDSRRLRDQQARALVERRAIEERARQDADEAAAQERQRREFEAAQALAATQQKAAELALALAREEQRAREAAERLTLLERHARRRQIALLSTLLIATASLAGLALHAANRASDARVEANRALSAAYVDRVVPGEPWTLALLARAVRMDPDSAMARALLVGHLSAGVVQRAEMPHDHIVNRAAFNASATRVLTMSGEGIARLWDPRTGLAVGDPLGQQGHATAAAFSPDGSRVVSASEDGTVRVWDAATGQQKGDALHHGAAVNAAVFDASGGRVVTASDDQTVRIWRPDNGSAIEIQAAGKPIVHASFDPTGTLVLSISVDGEAAVWNAETGAQVSRLSEARSEIDAITHAEFSHDGARVVAVLMDGTARVLVARGAPTPGVSLRAAGPIVSARFDPAGLRVITTSVGDSPDSDERGFAVRLWDARTGEPSPVQLNHDGWITAAGFSPDGALILTASLDRTARVWDAETGRAVGRPLRHSRPVRWAGFSPDGARVLTASEDGTAQIWDTRTGVEIGSALRHEGSVNAAAFSADGASIVTAASDRTARVWDARTGATIETRIRHAPGLLITLAALSPDGARLATAGSLDPGLPAADQARRADEEQVVQLWDTATGQPIGSALRHSGAIKSIRFSPAGAPRVLTASADNTARLWDALTGKPIGTVMQHDGPVFSAAFSHDGTRVVTGSQDNTASLWDASNGRPITRLQHPDAVRTAAFSTVDASRLVTGSADGGGRLWNAATGQQLGELPFECAGPRDADETGRPPVTAVAFSPDGTRILTSSDAESLLWNSETLERIGPCIAHDGARNLPVFSRSGSQVVTTSTTDVARVWDVRGEPVVRFELPREEAVLSAAFDGEGRLVTASQDGTARVRNVRTGEQAGLAVHHDTQLVWTVFSGNGSRILTLAADGIARIWDVPTGLREDALPLADLAEAIAGHSVDAAGVNHLENEKELADIRERAARAPSGNSFAASFMHWLFSDPATRTISPVSRIAVPEYVSRLITEGDPGWREARRLFPGHPAMVPGPGATQRVGGK